MSQIYFFTGENTFALRHERSQWKTRFAEKHGEENLLVLSSADVTYRLLLDEVGTMPFIGDKRLVIIDGVPKFEKEEIESLPQHIHPSCLLLFCDPKPDKRLTSVKVLLKIADVKEFAPLEGAALGGWIRAYAQGKGTACDARAASLLLEIVGENQDTLAQEIEKLAVFAGTQQITEDVVRRLAVPSGEREIWQLTNELARGQTQPALRYVRELLSRGEDPYGVWSILLWMLRNVVTVHAAAASGERNAANLAKMGVPFPSVRTLQPFADRLSPEKLSSIVNWAADTDIDLKTGIYKATAEAPEEILGLIDSFILRFAVTGPRSA